MKAPQTKPSNDRASSLQLIIRQQQGLAAKLVREGKLIEARRAQSRLQILSNQLALVQELLPRPGA
jgi:hypothetical protein